MPHRPFTADERREIERLVRRGIRGEDVTDRAGQLYAINPDEYGRLHLRIKRAEVERIQSAGIP